MSYANLLTSLGFEADPFAKTNADEEERLEQYFVAPPFFNAVFGDPAMPKSSIVFAPRGGGKTALKRRIELYSLESDFICVTYNQFDVAGKRPNDITLEYHLRNLVEKLLVAILTAVGDKGIEPLSHDERHILYLLVKEHLSQIDQTKLKANISSVKNFSTKAKEMWDNLTGPIGLALNVLLARIGLQPVDIQRFESQRGRLGGLADQMVALQMLGVKLGYRCVYVLVDRVDENSLTGTADKAYTFISPLISNLQILETPNFAFKFFLWDLLRRDYQIVARPDRIKYYVLKWSHEQLAQMLSERLKAHSGGKVASIQQISESSLPLPLDQAVAVFAQGSPRNVIRICKEILDQQSELDPSAGRISEAAIRIGFDRIAANITQELFSDTLIRELQKAGRCDFTIRYVYSDVFKFTQQAGLNKVKNWEDAGAVVQLGTIQESKGRKPSNHYGVAHILLAKHICPKVPIAEFLQKKVRVCPSCGEILVRDWDVTDKQQCNSCQRDVC
jgi:hypothetical protein